MCNRTLEIPPLNKKADSISLPSSDPSHWVNDHFEDRINAQYYSLKKKGLL